MEGVTDLAGEHPSAEDVCCRACMFAFDKDSMVFLYDTSSNNVADIFFNCTSLKVFSVFSLKCDFHCFKIKQINFTHSQHLLTDCRSSYANVVIRCCCTSMNSA